MSEPLAFAPTAPRGRRHLGHARLVGSAAGLTPYRVFVGYCGERGAEWFYTEDVAGREPCRRCAREYANSHSETNA